VEQDIDSAYAELGLAPDATELEVKAAWRRLVSQWHPDRNGSAIALAKMQRINRAVEAIRQAGFRGPGPAASAGGAKTGRPRRPQRRGNGARSAPHFDDTHKAASTASDDDAAATPKAYGAPPRTISRRVRLTLEEAAFGCTKVLQGKITAPCSPCALPSMPRLRRASRPPGSAGSVDAPSATPVAVVVSRGNAAALVRALGRLHSSASR
jgi:molecular chaperone DnaJ